MNNIIPNRVDFVNVLAALKRSPMVTTHGDHRLSHATIDGDSFNPVTIDLLFRYKLVEEIENPNGFAFMHYFRLTAPGMTFASQVLEQWKRFSFVEKLKISIYG